MATERNEGSQAGADLSRTRTARDAEGIEAGTTRSMANAGETTPAMGDMAPGTAEVRSDVRVERDTGFGAIAASDTTEGRSMQQEAKERMRQASDQAQNVANQAQQKARETASQAQSKANQAMNRMESRLEQSGVMSTIRNNPLPALGIAFGIGFLLAGSGDEEEEQEAKERQPRREQKRRKGGGGVMQSAKRQLTGAIMGGLSAAIAQEGKNLVGMAQGKGNQGGILGSLMENMTGGKTSQQQGTTHRRPSHQEMR